MRIKWHEKINQILVALSDGSLRLYYDPVSSARGALLCVSRPLRRARQQEVVREEMILSRKFFNQLFIFQSCKYFITKGLQKLKLLFYQ